MSSNCNSTASVGSDRSASSSPSMLVHSSSASASASAPAPHSESGADGMKLAKETVAELGIDEVATIFGFLPPEAIMLARVCKTWRDAAQKTIVPPCDFAVRDEKSYNAMRAMSTALPNLQQLTIGDLNYWHKYTDGEDPDEEWAAETANNHIHDINVISNFRNLRILQIIDSETLNGRYPALFNFPFLRKLMITTDYDWCLMKWDLEMLSGLPLLEELRCHCTYNNLPDYSYPTGNLSSLRVLKNTLERVDLFYCRNIRGNFMELADFPHLKELNLMYTAVTGDIRDIRSDDFPAIERLILPETVIGGIGHVFQRISDVPVFMETIYPLMKRKRNPTIFEQDEDYSLNYTWSLSQDSPDWYEVDGEHPDPDWYDRDWSGDPSPPFYLQIIEAGPRLGWSWCTKEHYCEVNWLDPEPRSDSNDYETYTTELQRIERFIYFYRGYYQPPTEQEYRRLREE